MPNRRSRNHGATRIHPTEACLKRRGLEADDRADARRKDAGTSDDAVRERSPTTTTNGCELASSGQRWHPLRLPSGKQSKRETGGSLGSIRERCSKIRWETAWDQPARGKKGTQVVNRLFQAYQSGPANTQGSAEVFYSEFLISTQTIQ